MINGRLILKGELKLNSPALIGCGVKDNTDIDIIKDSEGKPYIPATSLIGVLRTAIKSSELAIDKFWGYTKDKDSLQSAIRCDDLTLIENYTEPVEIRDGIKINPKTGIVDEGAKYDYEIISTGTKFNLFMEVSYDADNKEIYTRMLKTIEEYLKGGQISIGAKTNSGLGRVKLENSKIYDFDFTKKPAVYYWLKQDLHDSLIRTDIEPYTIESMDFIINASFRLKTSLIVRSYSEDPQAPDAVHIKSAGEDIIPGTSLKGSIRARALRIANTIQGYDKGNRIIDELFGFVFDDEKEAKARERQKGDAKRGRLRIEEVTLPKFVSELQTRIKIDRFTGGTIESALLETKPLFAAKDSNDIKNIKITIRDYKPHEAGLMLLVLKDLWTGDIAVGGEKSIGRGVFKGIKAEIKFNGKVIVIDNDLNSLKPEDMKELEGFVSSFVSC